MTCLECKHYWKDLKACSISLEFLPNICDLFEKYSADDINKFILDVGCRLCQKVEISKERSASR
jgi:hypothetical protein